MEKPHVWPLERLSRTEAIGLYSNWKFFSLNQNKIKIWFHVADSYDWCYSLIHSSDVLQSYTNKSFLSSSFLCLLTTACEPNVYAKHIVQLWDMHCACLFWSNLSLDMLVVTKNFQKISKSIRYTRNWAIKFFQVT